MKGTLGEKIHTALMGEPLRLILLETIGCAVTAAQALRMSRPDFNALVRGAWERGESYDAERRTQ